MSERQQTELVIASTLYLISSYATNNASEYMRGIIQRHLEDLSDREDLTEPLRQLCEQLSAQWANPRRTRKTRQSSQLIWLQH
jgi:hypothetical protein